jgi:hypothetical protein
MLGSASNSIAHRHEGWDLLSSAGCVELRPLVGNGLYNFETRKLDICYFSGLYAKKSAICAVLKSDMYDPRSLINREQEKG